MSSFLYRLGHTMFRRRRIVLAIWLAVLAAVVALSRVAGGATSARFTIPGTESQQVIDLLDERFPARSGSDARVVFAAPDGEMLTDEANRETIADALAEVGAISDVLSVTDPFAEGTASCSATTR